MKKYLALLIGVVVVSCQNEPKNYVTLSGKITNPQEKENLIVFKGRDYTKEIKVNEDGTFSDTLKIVEGTYMFKHSDQYGEIYLKNDTDLNLTTDYTDFDTTLKFEGSNADYSTFLIQKTLMIQNYLDSDVMDLPEDDFTKVILGLKDKNAALKSEFKGLDDAFFQEEDKNLEDMILMYDEFYQSRIAMRKALPAGTPSPAFFNYKNHDGSSTSLSDLKGKYVYIDVWATWCGPCIAEIPSLKEIEKKYQDQGIQFVSISIDVESAHEKWNQMVIDKDLGGIQLLADANWESKFLKDYKINGIPRFILIDPEGNIVNADAPRPSSSKLIELFKELNI